jgi:hypothetical protein
MSVIGTQEARQSAPRESANRGAADVAPRPKTALLTHRRLLTRRTQLALETSSSECRFEALHESQILRVVAEKPAPHSKAAQIWFATLTMKSGNCPSRNRF